MSTPYTPPTPQSGSDQLDNEVQPVVPVPTTGTQNADASNSAQRLRILRCWARLSGLSLLGVLIITLVSIGSGLMSLNRHFEGRIYPNIAIRGTSVGQLTTQAAGTVLTERYGHFMRQPITLVYSDRTWTPTLEQLGARLEIDRAVHEAMETGRKPAVQDQLWEAAAIWQQGIELPLRLTVDQQQMLRFLQASAAGLEYPAQDAALILQDTYMRAVPGKQGQQLLLDETLQDMTAALQTLEPQQVTLRTRTLQPLLDDRAATAGYQRLHTLLQGPLTLRVGANNYIWNIEELAPLVHIDRVADPAGDRLDVSLDRARITERLRAITVATGQPGSYPRVDWNNGDLKIIKAGSPGLWLDEEQASDLILAAAASSERNVSLPLVESNRLASAEMLHDLGIKELIAVGRSDFTGSAAYRITNIKAGMKLLNGLLLAPGEVFSFNDNVGHINAKNGFVQGYAIIQNSTRLEYGGGICQDSTTMFRAAFWAGLPIMERHEHSFYINWYDKYGVGDDGTGPGLDAAIYTGEKDLKFVNDTGHWLLIQTAVDEQQKLAEVYLYGTKPNRSVTATSRIYNRRRALGTVYVADSSIPVGHRKRTDTARGGMTIDVYRTITENGVAQAPELFRTLFRPWPTIYRVNPATLAPKPAPAQPPADGQPPVQPPADGQPPAQPPPPPGTQPAEGASG